MVLDMRTVLNIEGLLFLMCFFVLLILWVQVKGRFQGLRFWASTFFLAAAGTILGALREYLPVWVSIALANSLIGSGFVLLFLGSIRFVGKKVTRWVIVFVLVSFGAFIFIHTYYTFVEADLIKRIFNVTIFIAAYSAFNLLVLHGTSDREILNYSRGVRIASLIIVLVSIARLFGIAQIETNDFMASGVYDTSVVVTFTLAIVFLAFSLVLMVNRRHIKLVAENELNFRNSIDDSPLGIRLTDLRARTVYANQRLLDLYGYESIDDFARHSFEERYTPQSAQLLKDFLRCLKAGESLPEKYELSIVRDDGTVKVIEVYHKVILWNGAPHFQGTCIDITEKKRAEQEIIRRHDELQKFGTQVPGMLYIFKRNTDGRFSMPYTNETIQQIFGCTPEAVKNDFSPISSIIVPEDYPTVLSSIQKSARTLLPWEFEFRVQIPDHEITYVWGRSIPELQDDGSVLWYGFATDITEQKQAVKAANELQQELIAQNRLATVGQMAAGIAHEINNPLTGVVGYASLLLERPLQEDIRKDIEVINEGAQRVSSVVRRMLTFARQQDPEPLPTNINEIVESSIAIRLHEMHLNSITVVRDLADDLPDILVDRGQIQQVFLNIIMNAEFEMKEAHDGGNLTIKTERSDDWIRITFTDDGPGIPEKNIGKIFDPFFTTRTVGSGTGLGLSVSYGIISRHNGKISVSSEEGKGATFIVELPLINGHVKMAPPSEKVPKSNSAGKQVLVIDDDPIVREYLRHLLIQTV